MTAPVDAADLWPKHRKNPVVAAVGEVRIRTWKGKGRKFGVWGPQRNRNQGTYLTLAEALEHARTLYPNAPVEHYAGPWANYAPLVALFGTVFVRHFPENGHRHEHFGVWGPGKDFFRGAYPTLAAAMAKAKDIAGTMFPGELFDGPWL